MLRFTDRFTLSLEAAFDLHFLPRDAILAWVLAMALCPSIRLSVTSRCSIETAG